MIFRPALAFALLLGAFLISGCDRLKSAIDPGKQAKVTTPAAAASSAPAAAGPAAPVEPPVLPPPTSDTSAHFNRVTGRVDVGGKMLHFEDHVGQREMFIGIVNGIMSAAPPEEKKVKIDPGALVDATGLAQAVASGKSIKRDGDAWLLRQYSYIPAGRSGLASVYGKEPMKFRSPSMIPAATDLVVETRLDTTALPAVIDAIGKAIGQEKDTTQAMATKLPSGDTVESLLAKTDLQLILGVDISSWKATPTSPQAVDFFLQIDGAGELLKVMLPEMEKSLGKATVQGSRRGWEIPLQPLLQPKALLLYDDQGTLTFTSRAEYLKYVETAAMKLGAWKEYQAACNHFPESGNLLVYVSPQVAPAIAMMLRRAAPQMNAEGAAFTEFATKNLPAKPWSLCVSCEPDGIMTLAEMPFPVELTGGPLPYLAGTSVLFVGARAWKKGSDRAACVMNVRNVQQAVRAYQNMNSLKPGDPIPWNKVIGEKGFLTKQPACLEAGGGYTFVKTVPKNGALACTCSHPEHQPANHDNW
ncbi:hypothetical protein [Luteolibacter sp. Populi]|uniref:hypothetical protein n=1 Tax=Luteolibacter sp. Populi TaxID=3230487 RepID=UPI00346508D8